MILIVHGGAGNGKPKKIASRKIAEALEEGFALLRKGAALDAVVLAITIMEDSAIFNAGAGGLLQMDGVRRLDASLMNGRDLSAGAVLGLEGIRNPIRAARRIMSSPHVMLSNVGARKMARDLEPLSAPGPEALARLDRLRRKEKEAALLYEEYFSTVGAAALDGEGNVAAGTSTGGSSAMLPGRVGDSPVIGAGTYADNASGAVSCTGRGEAIIRLSLAKEITMNLDAMTPSRAARHSLRRLALIGGQGGVIVTDRKGRFVIMHTTAFMAAGCANRKGVFVQDRFSGAK